MTLTIQSPGFKATKKLMKFVKSNILKLAKHRDRILEAQVILRLDRSNTQEDKICELRLAIPGNDLFATRQGRTFEEAVITCIHAIKPQLIRWEDSVDKGNRRGATTIPGPTESPL